MLKINPKSYIHKLNSQFNESVLLLYIHVYYLLTIFVTKELLPYIYCYTYMCITPLHLLLYIHVYYLLTLFVTEELLPYKTLINLYSNEHHVSIKTNGLTFK